MLVAWLTVLLLYLPYTGCACGMVDCGAVGGGACGGGAYADGADADGVGEGVDPTSRQRVMFHAGGD